MKKKQVLAGLLVAASMATGALAVEGVSKTINVFMGGITVKKDGEVLQLKDGAGNPVEAMIYNGTTYMPVRAVAEAAGLEVDWDQATRTVLLGGEPETYLDQLAPYAFERMNEATDRYTTQASVWWNSVYHRGVEIRFNTNTVGDADGQDNVTRLSYALNKEYTGFQAYLRCASSNFNVQEGTVVTVMGDDKELFRSPVMKELSTSIELDLDVTGVDVLEFVFTTPDSSSGSTYDFEQVFQLLSARLSK